MDDRPPSSEARRGPYRSLFWPVVFIAGGLVWLLASMGWFPQAQWPVLMRLWPVVLILIGLDMLIGRPWPVLGAVLGLAAVAGAVAVALYAPAIGIAAPEGAPWTMLPRIALGDGESAVQTSQIAEPIGEAESARIYLELPSDEVRVAALSDRDDLLFSGTIEHVGELRYEVRGEREKRISLSPGSSWRWAWSAPMRPLRWELSLSAQIPLELRVTGGSGSATLDLEALQLRALQVAGGSGSLEIDLPDTVGGTIDLRGGSGRMRASLPDGARADLLLLGGSGSMALEVGSGADLTAEIRGGSGRLTVEVPRDAALRIVVHSEGSGSIDLPAQVELVDAAGVWETEGYGDAERRIDLVLHGGSGRLQVR